MPEHVLVFGGTSDALALCHGLKQCGIHFTLSVATPAGQAVASEFAAELITGRMTRDIMIDWIRTHRVDWIIDAAHPYAQVLHTTVLDAAQVCACPVIRYERADSCALTSHPLISVAATVEEACRYIQPHQHKILLTTGSKDLATFCRCLPDKTLYARVLPTSSVIAQCEANGLGIAQIIAMKGPFSYAMNRALYLHINPDVVITKESGQIGGFAEKIQPCLELHIPCVVLARPTQHLQQGYFHVFRHVDEGFALFRAWQQGDHLL